ncbi:AraC family transcriptional regulator [Bacillus sp. ISL-51]|uniref:helix-turn-helix transcriptional regulator n=1 Tax=Bacteria TaxID=2 RepID=UPI001BEC8E0E|nr:MULTISPECIES: helix-turn-helix transcriptional regulator [Bacteria]MBT2575198.1 AraC family transcriptional regulator [Bacillus sp. ISL-51]MBT2633492.1 AraC family transcriptional regulator [Bacillus sp. ISL-26]MBT2714074.1 AraC family transcriptional regulator [Pseudomonas sp. ISL-88]
MKQNLEFISKMISDAYNVPTFVLNNKNNHIFSSGDHLKHPLFHSIEEFINRLIQPEDQQNVPLIRTTNYLETFIVFHLSSIETIIIGPFSSYEVTENIVNGIMHDYQIFSAYQQELFLYYSQLEWLNQKQILSLCSLTYYLICQEPLEEELIRSQIMNSEEIEPTHIEQVVRHRRLDASFHMDYRVEQKIWQCVKEGDKEKLLQHLDTIKIEGVGLLSKRSHLRNIKNQTIISIALATRAAIDGGLYPEIAYTMSDISIQKVEETSELQKIYLIGDDFLYSLVDRVNETRENNHSKAVQICKNYIFNHIFEQISIKDLADMVHLNPVYLSQLFKKETNKPLGKYIQDEKIKEAQKLLIQSEHSVADICMLLHFNDQSYFSSIFKKYTGLTPIQYRKNPVIH